MEEKRQEIVFKEFHPCRLKLFLKIWRILNTWLKCLALLVELKKMNIFFNFLAYVTPRFSWIPSKNVSPFGPAVWPTRGNIYTNILFYHTDETLIIQFYSDIFSSKNVMYLFLSFKRSLWVYATNSNFQKLSLYNLIVCTFEISYLIIWSDRIDSLKCLKSTTSSCKEFVAKTQFCLPQNS